MQPALEALGFETDIRSDLDKPEEFRSAVRQFLLQRKADAGDIVLVLYSGHGMQLEGSTYFLGKNYRTVTEPQAAAFGHAFSADDLVKELEKAPPYARIVVIDACRVNAFTAQGQRGGVSLRQNYPNTVVLFSNEPGKTVPARAATSLRSPFIEALIYALGNANSGIEEIFDMARKATIELSPTQMPQMIKSLEVDGELLAAKAPRVRSNRAAELVNQAKPLYADRSWEQYREVFLQAKAVTNDPNLIARINNEILWVKEVEEAESASDKNDFGGEAAHWDRAFGFFPVRTWTVEKAALARLKGDRDEEAIPLLSRLSFAKDDGIASRARLMLASLVKNEPKLNELVTQARTEAPLPSRAEFELVEVKP
jgi:hypothetical protein